MNSAASRVRPSQKESALAALSNLFGNRFSTSLPVREQHTNTMTWVTGGAPDAVVFPCSTQEVQEAVRVCAAHALPVVPFGAGTSFEGHVNAPFGGVSFDMREMKNVLAVHDEDFDCVVEPGITRKALNEHLRASGLFFPVDPGADASLGGMASTRASGTTTVRYGTMKDNVLALKAVLPNGELISTSRRARKSSAGYDLTRLFVGAEGTLGVITELTLKLHPIPEAVSAGVCTLPTIEACCNLAITAIQSGITLARIELLDEVQIDACNVYSGLGMPEQPTLFVEFNGTDQGVAEQAERFGALVAEFGGHFEWAKDADARARLWKARHDVFWAQRSYRAGASAVVTDVCVPVSRLAECVGATKRDIEASGLVAPIVGHVGDGNFHSTVLVMMDDPAEVATVRAYLDRLARRAIDMEGTCTGEHGIGEGKKHFLAEEHGEATVAAMRAIKGAIDPQGIMNPGKIV